MFFTKKIELASKLRLLFVWLLRNCYQETLGSLQLLLGKRHLNSCVIQSPCLFSKTNCKRYVGNNHTSCIIIYSPWQFPSWPNGEKKRQMTSSIGSSVVSWSSNLSRSIRPDVSNSRSLLSVVFFLSCHYVVVCYNFNCFVSPENECSSFNCPPRFSSNFCAGKWFAWPKQAKRFNKKKIKCLPV